MSALAAVLVLLVVLAVPVGFVLRTSWRATGSQIDSVIQHVLSHPSPGPPRVAADLTPVCGTSKVVPAARAVAPR